MRKIEFGAIRNHLSVIDRISICNKDTLHYENYVSVKEVPEKYNKWFVHGIGMIDSEVFTEKRASLHPHLEVILCPKKSLFSKKECAKMESQDYPRFLKAIDEAIQGLELEALCYGYTDEPEHMELIALLNNCRNKIKKRVTRERNLNEQRTTFFV